MTETNASINEREKMLLNAFDSILDDDDANGALRMMLVNSPDYNDPSEYECDAATHAIIAEMLDELLSDDRTQREYLTEIALSLSLCPIHLIDYAICFDDRTTGCDQIRFIHPLHDT